MADLEISDDSQKLANHTLAYLRALDKKVDLVLETIIRFGERLGRVERDVMELKRDVHEVKSDIILLENKVLSSQSEILRVLHRLADAGIPPPADDGD